MGRNKRFMRESTGSTRDMIRAFMNKIDELEELSYLESDFDESLDEDFYCEDSEDLVSLSTSTLKRKLKTASKEEAKAIKAELSCRGVYLGCKGSECKEGYRYRRNSSRRSIKEGAYGRDAKYMYVLTHGFGPGTIPRDVTVYEYEDRPDGTTLIWVDRPFTYKELEEYDIPSETQLKRYLGSDYGRYFGESFRNRRR